MIIDHYLRREIALPFFVVLLVLLSVFLSYSLTRYLIEANAGLLLPAEVIRLTLLKGLISLEVLIPLSLYLGVLIGLGRLHSDSEIYAMRASGISEHRALRPILRITFQLAVLIALLSLFVRPWGYEQMYRIKARAEASTEVERIRAASFYRFEESGRTVFVREIESDGRVEGVFIHTQKDGDLQIITAPAGRLEYDVSPGFNRLTLTDAGVFKRVVAGPDLFGEFGSLSLLIAAGEPESAIWKTKSKSTFELADFPSNDDRAEFQWRFSTPLSALLLALLAIPLSRGRPRQGRFARILGAIIIYAFYFNFLNVSRTWVEQGVAPGIWWVPGLLSALVLAFYVPWRRLSLRLTTLKAPGR